MLLNSELDKWARENNLTRLELTVVSSNIVAKHLYEKNGFKIEGTRKNAMIIDDKYADEYYMAKLYKDSCYFIKSLSSVLAVLIYYILLYNYV